MIMNHGHKSYCILYHFGTPSYFIPPMKFFYSKKIISLMIYKHIIKPILNNSNLIYEFVTKHVFENVIIGLLVLNLCFHKQA